MKSIAETASCPVKQSDSVILSEAPGRRMEKRCPLARIMHRFSSRSAESAGLTRRASEAPASVLYGTLSRPTERNTGRTSDFGDAVENLCIIRARQPNLLAYSLVFLFVLTVFPTCGYRVASQNRLSPSIKSLVVLPFENQTTAFEVEQIITQALIRAFVERSSYRVVNDPAKADAVLKGVISRMSANPVLFAGDTFGSTFLVTLIASVELRERGTGKILFQNDRYIFREQYVINVDIKNFFSELNPALRRIASDFASSVATTVIEEF